MVLFVHLHFNDKKEMSAHEKKHIDLLHGSFLRILHNVAARLGRTIKWDPMKETIVGDDVAASFMSREQRSGFELPEVW